MDNVYFLTRENLLVKLDDNGGWQQQFNAVAQHGELHAIDVSNPLRLLLWYRDFGSAVLLDRFLKPTAELELRMAGYGQASALAQSYDNNLWLFDQVDYSLKKINTQGQELMRTPDFRQIFDDPPLPVKIYDDNQWLYLADTTKGIYRFDYFGTFQKFIPIPNFTEFAVYRQELFVNRGNAWYYLDGSSGETWQITLPYTLPVSQGMVTPRFYYFVDAQKNLYRLPLLTPLQQ